MFLYLEAFHNKKNLCPRAIEIERGVGVGLRKRTSWSECKYLVRDKPLGVWAT